MRLTLAFLLAATPALADPPLSADAFDTLTLGRTMTWSLSGTVYGVEQYLPDRRVRWTELGDDCKSGYWYPQGPLICFQYEDETVPDCWSITTDGAGMLAHYATDVPEVEPVQVIETAEPMACFGPKVGV